MDLKVLDIVDGCNTSEQGELLFLALDNKVEEVEELNILFTGVSDVTSSFINASIVRMVLKSDFEEFKSRVVISDISKPAAEMVRRCVRNALTHRAA